MNNDALVSKYGEDVVKWCAFDETVTQLRRGFGDITIRDLNSLIDKAVAAVRRDKRGQGKRH